jgi:hypothetical protein
MRGDGSLDLGARTRVSLERGTLISYDSSPPAVTQA